MTHDNQKVENSKSTRSIKNYLISPNEQIGLAVVSYVILFIALASQTLFVIKISQGESFKLLVHELNDYPIQQIAILSFLIFSLLGGILLFLVNIYYTHKIYGSLHAIRNQIKKALNGEPCQPLKGRKGDKVQDLIQLVNSLVDAYQKK